MTGWIRFHPFIFLIVLGIAALAYWGTLNTRGYCFAEGRYLSEKELYRAAIRDGLRSLHDDDISKRLNGLSRKKYEQTIHEMTTTFQSNNQDCCRIITHWKQWKDEGWFLPSAWGRFTGSQRATMEINYIGKRQNNRVYDNAGPRVIYRTVGNCGQIYKFH